MKTKNILITGSTRGIGLACAKLLSKDFKIIGISENKPKTEVVGIHYQANLSDIVQTDNVLKTISSDHGSFLYIINNAGISLPEDCGKINLDIFQKVMDTNVRASLQISQFFLKDMIDNNFGRIINLTSVAINGMDKRCSYSTSKNALIGLTKTMALELSKYGITVNSVCPGAVETELFRATRPVGSMEENLILSKIPAGRIGKPEEIANLVQFLISDSASYISGQNIVIDGGLSLGV